MAKKAGSKSPKATKPRKTAAKAVRARVSAVARPKPKASARSASPAAKAPGRKRPAVAVRPRTIRALAPAATGAALESAGKADGHAAETPLTRDEIEQFRELLLAKRREILGDVSTLHNEALNKDRREAAGDLSSMPIHMADLGSDNYELEFTLGLIEGERAILKEIDEALDRIKNKSYGVCLATGKPIGKARLKAKPWAKFCYEYTLAQEKGRERRF